MFEHDTPRVVYSQIHAAIHPIITEHDSSDRGEATAEWLARGIDDMGDATWLAPYLADDLRAFGINHRGARFDFPSIAASCACPTLATYALRLAGAKRSARRHIWTFGDVGRDSPVFEAPLDWARGVIWVQFAMFPWVDRGSEDCALEAVRH
ncbi:hypothetical protein [Albimonas pacifica]|uniref:Uncharacterized protein n=1 Tax=Albimonas pacifica TaxID=1114924 RepID=A0A1I3PP09_9RHOB|nr:hypothetical protein [Albimonas pacifica]SFJ23070.1 hypothetical protein SAMN05216258_1195 [Albimonas pacifica]